MTDRLTLATESIARNTEILTLVSLQIPLVAGVGMTHLYFNILRDQRPGALLRGSKNSERGRLNLLQQAEHLPEVRHSR